jgi:hypothetical protein
MLAGTLKVTGAALSVASVALDLPVTLACNATATHVTLASVWSALGSAGACGATFVIARDGRVVASEEEGPISFCSIATAGRSSVRGLSAAFVSIDSFDAGAGAGARRASSDLPEQAATPSSSTTHALVPKAKLFVM